MAFWLETVVGYKMKTHQNGMAYICSALPDSSGKWRLSLGSTNLKKVSHNPGGDCNCYWGKPTFVNFTSFLPKWSTTTTPDKISNTKKTDKPDNSAANHHTVVLFQVLVLVGPFRKKKHTQNTQNTALCFRFLSSAPSGIDVSHTHRLHVTGVGPEEIQRQNAPEVDQIGPAVVDGSLVSCQNTLWIMKVQKGFPHHTNEY